MYASQTRTLMCVMWLFDPWTHKHENLISSKPHPSIELTHSLKAAASFTSVSLSSFELTKCFSTYLQSTCWPFIPFYYCEEAVKATDKTTQILW